MPLIKKQDIDLDKIELWNYTKTKLRDDDNKHKTIHFFTYDWLFENVYEKPEIAMEKLSQYYAIVHLKETEYLEYKYKKQMYLLNLDYETVDNINKPALLEKYKRLYASQMESLYKGLLKHYSIKLADNLTPGAKEEIYNKRYNLQGKGLSPLKKLIKGEQNLFENSII